MVTMIVCIRRKHGLTRQDFSRYWREVHGPLVASVPEYMRHVRSYKQYHFCDQEDLPKMFGKISDYDGVAAQTFDTPADIEIALTEPRYLEIIRPDEYNFIDLDNCMSFLTEGYVVHNSAQAKKQQ